MHAEPAANDSPTERCLAAHVDAQEKRELADLVAARDALRTCAAETCPALVQRDCVTLLAEVQRAIPSVIVDVVIEGEPEEPEQFWLNGEARSVPRQPLELNPGVHQFRVRHTVKGKTLERTMDIVVQPSVRRQIVRIELDSPTATPSGVGFSSADQRDLGKPLRIAGFTTLALGIAAGAGSLGTGIAGLKGRADAQGECAPFCDGSRVGVIRAELLAADILGAAAGALLISGVVLLAVGYARRPPGATGGDRKKAARRAHVTPSLAGVRIDW